MYSRVYPGHLPVLRNVDGQGYVCWNCDLALDSCLMRWSVMRCVDTRLDEILRVLEIVFD